MALGLVLAGLDEALQLVGVLGELGLLCLPRLVLIDKLTHRSANLGREAEQMPPRYRALVLVAAFGGLRWGELAGLRRKRIDLERSTVTVAEQLVEVNGAFSVGPPKSAAGRRTVALPAA
jgi:integrase